MESPTTPIVPLDFKAAELTEMEKIKASERAANRLEIHTCLHLSKLEHMHTKGPWGIEITETTNWIGPLREDGKVNEIVCQIDREDLKPEVLVEKDANARLMADAPKMLAAIKYALELEKAWMLEVGGVQKMRDTFVEIVNDHKTNYDTPPPPKKPACEWNEDAGFETDCGNCFYFTNDDGPKENGFKFCPFCGKPITK